MTLAHTRPKGRPLEASDFTRIASGGFGDPQNSLAHSMAWFHGQLYVGTTRTSERRADQLQVNAGRRALKAGAHEQSYDLDQRAQIWRYDPRADHWQQIFVSPIIDMHTGRSAPREIGYRSMAVFRATGACAPVLYVSPIATLGNLILYSEDGERFVPITPPGGESRNAWSFRTFVPLNGKLYTSPVGSIGTHLIERNLAERPIVLENDDPVRGSWRRISEPGFDDPANASIYELAAFNGYLYAGTFNPYTGFQIWKMRAGCQPYSWQRVIVNGAFRGNANEAAVSMCVFGDALYIGTGIQGLGYDRTYDAGPAAAELIRINADDSWDLIVGEERRTIAGVKVPLSGLGPGFDHVYNSVIWRMVEHDGWLYAGTHDWCSLLRNFTLASRTGRAQRWRSALHYLIDEEGGFDLWRSPDGIEWEVVTRVGFGNPANYGLRTLVSTPQGLFIGTVTLPDKRGDSDIMRATAESHGGCEIWWGSL